MKGEPDATDATDATETTRVKICGLRRPGDARALVLAGGDAVGLVFAESPRRVTLEEARVVAAAARAEADRVSRPVEAWGVVVNESLDKLEEMARGVPLDVLQLHGDETPGFARELARRLEGTRLVRAVRVRDAASLAEVERLWATGLFDAILLDALVESSGGADGGHVKDGSDVAERPRGGTGRTFDWGVAREAARRVPVVLAGGLTPDNVAEAIRRVRPVMVDASSGVESSRGVKDAALIERFVREARSAGGGVWFHDEDTEAE